MEELESRQAGEKVPYYIGMACLLVREGANPHTTATFLGMEAMKLCPPEMVPLVNQMAAESQR